MPAPDPRRPSLFARLAAVLSLRTISGKLIVGLLVLFGLASVMVSVVTANSLNNSLMSSLNQQLQTATQAWRSCAFISQAEAGHNEPGQGSDNEGSGQADPDGSSPVGYGACSNSGQAAGTLEEVLLSNGTVSYKNLVSRAYALSGTDQAMLLDLPPAKNQNPAGPSASAPGSPGPGKIPPAPPAAPTSIRTLDSLGGQFMLTKVPGPNGTELVTGLSLAAADKTLSNVDNTEHMVFAAVLLLAVVMGTGLVELSLRPLRRVAATATRVTELPLDSGEVTLPAGVPDTDPRTEVGRVGAAFNRMLFHVEKALGRRAASEARLTRFL